MVSKQAQPSIRSKLKHHAPEGGGISINSRFNYTRNTVTLRDEVGAGLKFHIAVTYFVSEFAK